MSIPSEAEFDAALIDRHGREVFEKLKNASAAVAGLGGLGSNIALSLARAGVGELLLADFDRVDITNLNRQQYGAEDIGMYKTDAAERMIKRAAPYINIKKRCVRVTEENAAEIFSGFGIVCEAFDAAEEKAMLINALLCAAPDTVVISGSGMAGCGSSNTITTRRAFDRLYVCGDGVTGISAAEPLMAPRVAVCANHMANMALRLMLGKEAP